MVIGAATAALALFALVAMHGLPITPASATTAAPGGESHHAMAAPDPAAAMGHDHGAGASQASAPSGAAATVDAATSTTPHSHSLWHLCLAVLVAFAGLTLVASSGRRLADLIPRARGRLVRVLESRALDPPTQAGLCLLRC